jgi:hypothetical protein
MAPQRLEKVQFAPGNGMDPAPRGPTISGIGARSDHCPVAEWPTRRATHASRRGGRKSLKVA